MDLELTGELSELLLVGMIFADDVPMGAGASCTVGTLNAFFWNSSAFAITPVDSMFSGTGTGSLLSLDTSVLGSGASAALLKEAALLGVGGVFTGGTLGVSTANEEGSAGPSS